MGERERERERGGGLSTELDHCLWKQGERKRLDNCGYDDQD